MMVKVIHKPSGYTESLNQTSALRLMAYSKKHDRGWEYVVEEEATTKKASKVKKNENTKTGGDTSDSK